MKGWFQLRFLGTLQPVNQFCCVFQWVEVQQKFCGAPCCSLAVDSLSCFWKIWKQWCKHENWKLEFSPEPDSPWWFVLYCEDWRLSKLSLRRCCNQDVVIGLLRSLSSNPPRDILHCNKSVGVASCPLSQELGGSFGGARKAIGNCLKVVLIKGVKGNVSRQSAYSCFNVCLKFSLWATQNEFCFAWRERSLAKATDPSLILLEQFSRDEKCTRKYFFCVCFGRALMDWLLFCGKSMLLNSVAAWNNCRCRQSSWSQRRKIYVLSPPLISKEHHKQLQYLQFCLTELNWEGIQFSLWEND